MRDVLIKVLGLVGLGSLAGGASAGVATNGGDWWEVGVTAAGILLAGGFGGVVSLKWAQLKKLTKEVSEALVAMGLCGIAATKALEDNRISADERTEIAGKIKDVGSEFQDVCRAATKLISK